MALCIGIIDAKLLLCHGISDKSRDNIIQMRELNDRTVYEWFKTPFPVDYGITALNLPPIPIYDSSRQNKRAHYTPDPLPHAISIASGKYVSTLTTPCDYPQDILISSDDHINYILIHQRLSFTRYFQTSSVEFHLSDANNRS